MVRFFATHADPVNGSHLHLVFTSHAARFQDCLDALARHRAATAPNQRPLTCFDLGPGDSEVRPMAILASYQGD